MWTIHNGNDLLLDPRIDGFRMTAATLTQELNKADSLRFTIHTENANYSTLARLKKTLEVRNNGTVKSRLRMLDNGIGWYNEKPVLCEGALAWLNDSIQRPFSFPVDPEHATPADYLAFLIGRHNAQEPANRQILVGNCTVTDPNDYISRSDTQYSTTFQLIKEGLLKPLGGYLWLRYDGADTYLDYLADFNVLANQPVTFGVNMLKLDTTQKGSEICTAVLPLGAVDEATKERITISNVADETTSDVCKAGDLVYSKDAEALWGSRIVHVEIWNDVTIASNLVPRAKERLAQLRQLPSTVSITAADLADAGYNYNNFSVGTYVDIVDDVHAPHGLLARYLVVKLKTDLLNPANSVLTLGATTTSLTERTAQTVGEAMQTVETNIEMKMAEAIGEVVTQNQSAIEQSEALIRSYVSETTYSQGEIDTLISALSTAMEQTAAGWTFNFEAFQQEFDEYAEDTNGRFSALQSYIRFEGGSIELGNSASKVTLKIENDQIGIYANSNLITYWTIDDFVSPKSLKIPVQGRLVLGDFAFEPRANGSLDFHWIGA